MSQPNHQGTIPLHRILRRRRQELHLNQAHVAEALDVSPEAIGLWERGRRRMDLEKVPRIAQVLHLQHCDLCRMAIYEFHPTVYAALFGHQAPCFPRSTDSLELVL